MCASRVRAQGPTQPGAPVTLQNAPQRDTTNRRNSNTWRDDPVRISFRRATSQVLLYPDTSLHTLHRRPFTQSWMRDLGNTGSPVRSLMFTADGAGRTGPSLGYHVFDVYRLNADSVFYYNTTRPYSNFSYNLGSKTEQIFSVFYTQNISPRWNFAVQYGKINSPGFYQLERTNQDHGSLSTHYTGPGQHYELFGAFVYNREQQDENGGITADSFLSDSRYSDRKTVPVAFYNPQYTVSSSAGLRSSVTNDLRDYNILIQHGYTWGHTDTLYNADSTQYHIQLTPRFRIAHRLEAGSERHVFQNYMPDPALYVSFAVPATPVPFPFPATTITATDSIYSAQKWGWVDNRITLNGFLGKRQQQLLFSAGIGNRVDDFSTNYATGTTSDNILSNYLIGDLRKEALAPGQWSYSGHAQLFFTGEAAGNFLLQAEAGKDLGGNWGALKAGISQQLTEAPYSDKLYETQFFTRAADLGNESFTRIYANIRSDKFGLSVGVRNDFYTAYIYYEDIAGRVTNGRLEVVDYTTPFTVTQVWARKTFRFRSLVLDNDVLFQQASGGPVHVPALTGRHQLSVETYFFHHLLKVATGAEVRYNTAYKADGYSPLYNRFYYQVTDEISNKPELSAFFNFKVKRFRCYVMTDQLQALLGYNNIIAPGYPQRGFMIRFGFSWVLVN